MKPDFVPQRPRLVAIVGGSGSGKTWLATELQFAFGKECARLCLDHFYRDCSHLSAEQRARINFDHPRAIDWPLVEHVLGRCVRGESALVPKYDFAQHRRLPEGIWWQPKPLVLVEGLWVLHRPALRGRFDLRIFLECTEQVRFERRLRRDVVERARTPDSVSQQFRRTVVPMHERYVAPQARGADVRLSAPVSIDQLTELIERLRTSLVE
ncbi:MAG: hypothetical protein L0Z50_20520 [Verrucomicrobiales bacterium]|nr:hypothetical protein [Verrucomicrobiales bacterium]